MKGQVMYRYEVVGIDGTVPDAIASMVGEPDSVLLYPEDRGEWSTQGYYRSGEGVIGHWTIERRGSCLVDGTTVVQVYEEDE